MRSTWPFGVGVGVAELLPLEGDGQEGLGGLAMLGNKSVLVVIVEGVVELLLQLPPRRGLRPLLPRVS